MGARFRSWLFAAAIALTSLGAQAAPLRTAIDEADLEAMRRLKPSAFQLFNEADARLASGDAAGAARMFRQVSEQAPFSQLTLRRICQASTWAKQREAAIATCDQAIQRGRAQPASMRAAVAALMSSKPSVVELALALNMVESIMLRAPLEPWAYAARCDIAERLGEPTLLAACRAELQARAPDHYETSRAAAMSAGKPSRAALAAWIALALAGAGTAYHALRSGLRRTRRRVQVGVAAAVFALAYAPVPASAAEEDGSEGTDSAEPTSESPRAAGGLSKWPVNPADPVGSVPTPEQRDGNPLQYGYHVMDLVDLARNAERHGQFSAAAKYYDATIKADPESAVSYRRACQFHEKAGELEQALSTCRGALGAQGSELDDHVRYAHLLFVQPSGLTPVQVEDLNSVIKALGANAKTRPAGLEIECELAGRQDDGKRLEKCATELGKLAPSSPKTISFQWTVAMRHGDLREGERLLAEARKSSMSPQGLSLMERGMQAERTLPRRFQRNWRILALLFGLTAAAFGAALLRRRANGLTATTPATPTLPPQR